MHPTIAAILQCQHDAGIETTEDQRAAFVRALAATLGGGPAYFPKRAARPSGAAVSVLRPATVVRDLREKYGVSRRTAYRWLRRR